MLYLHFRERHLLSHLSFYLHKNLLNDMWLLRIKQILSFSICLQSIWWINLKRRNQWHRRTQRWRRGNWWGNCTRTQHCSESGERNCQRRSRRRLRTYFRDMATMPSSVTDYPSTERSVTLGPSGDDNLPPLIWSSLLINHTSYFTTQVWPEWAWNYFILMIKNKHKSTALIRKVFKSFK